MADLIIKNNGNVTYQDFLVEAYTAAPELVGKDEEGNYYKKFSSTPVVENSGGFLINVRDSDIGSFAKCKTTKNMGDYDSIFNSSSKSAEYCEVYDYVTPVDDGEGGSYYRSPRFGVFCGDDALGAGVTARVKANRGL